MEWFLLNSGRVEGPFKAQQLKDKVASGELDSEALVCRQGDPHWKPLVEFELQILEDAKPDESLKDWILLTDNMSLALSKDQDGQFVQSGPYTTAEIKELINSAQAKYSDFIWKAGFEKWMRINEVDDFFNLPSNQSSSEEAGGEANEISAQNTTDQQITDFESNGNNQVVSEDLLNQVLEQTHLPAHDFVENLAPEEAPPLEASPIDETLLKPLGKPKEQPQFVISSPQSPLESIELINDQSHELGATRAMEIELSSQSTEVGSELASSKNPHKQSRAFTFDWAVQSFPWLMAGLASILVVMVGVWAMSLNSEPVRENAQTPPPVPVKKKQEKPADISKQITESKPNPAPFVVSQVEVAKPQERIQRRSPIPQPKIEKTQLHILAWRLLKKAERLEREYDVLRENPSVWRRFYHSWQNDFNKTTDLMNKHDARNSMVLRQLQIGRGRLGQRAQMMDKAIMGAAPVSSDFRQEDLPSLFRNIKGQISRRE